MKDIFEEILSSISKNKLRTGLTGFSIAWGIFILIVLLGAGNGLSNGMKKNFSRMATNSISIYPGRTSMTWKGLQKNRSINLKGDDAQLIENAIMELADASPVLKKWGSTLSVGSQYTNTRVFGVYPNYMTIANTKIKDGRGINQSDINEQRKVAIIHENTAGVLFRDRKDKNFLGCNIKVDGVIFSVAGIYTDDSRSTEQPVYIPYTTNRTIFKPSNEPDEIAFIASNITSTEKAELVKTSIREKVGGIYQFNPEDMNALYIWDRAGDYLQYLGITGGLSMFIWIIGIGSLMGGIVGISNIMLITVKERTKEIGIRKALGASPRSILTLVLVESVFITSLFGYIGMLLGIGLMELINKATTSAAASNGPNMFQDPGVDLSIVISATLVLIIAGTIAGYVPARKAVNIKPIDALRG